MSMGSVCREVTRVGERSWMASYSLGWFVGALLILTMAGVAAGASSEPGITGGSATEAIRETVSQITRLLKDPTLARPEKAEERRRQLEQVAAGRIAYAEMAKRSLGAHWQALSDTEREEFVALFQRLLSKMYIHRIEGYTGEQVHYLGERVVKDFVEVRTKIVSEKVEIPVDYRLLQMDGQWRIYDVLVDGVGIVSNYRGQFTRILRSSSYADLVEQLRAKVEENQRFSQSLSRAENQ